MRIAALIACHNRRELTLRCLQSVRQGAQGHDVTVYLLDDASTDGTGAAVRANFPETVIIEGDGNCFWNGGMVRAWGAARAKGYDAYLLLNDDVVFDGDFLARMTGVLAQVSPPAVIVGATRAAASGAITYGGFSRVPSAWRFTLRLAQPRAEPVRVDTFNANCVLVSSEAQARIGILDPAYYHSFADIDYGLRATRAGIAVWLAPGTIGTCEVNPKKIAGGWGDPRLSLRQRWKILRTPKGLDPASWFRLMRRHGGLLWPLTAVMPYRYLLGFSIGRNSASR